jgi:hypothetical protein
MWSLFMPMPKRMRSTRSSRGVSEASTRVVVSPAGCARQSKVYDKRRSAKDKDMTIHSAAKPVLVGILIVYAGAVLGQPLRRATVAELKLGAHISAQPLPDEFKGFACGSNGGPPRRKLADWSEFRRCPAERNGLHEVYFRI